MNTFEPRVRSDWGFRMDERDSSAGQIVTPRFGRTEDLPFGLFVVKRQVCSCNAFFEECLVFAFVV